MTQQFHFGPEALPYCARELGAGKSMALQLLRHLDLHSGQVMTFLPAGTAPAAAHNFTTGGVLPPIPKSKAPRAAQVGVVMAHLHSTKIPSGRPYVVFEDQISQPDSYWMDDSEEAFYLYDGGSGEEIHYFMHAGNVDERALRAVMSSALTGPGVGVLTSLPEDVPDLAPQTPLAPEVLALLAKRAEAVLVGAYEAEGWLIWQRDPNANAQHIQQGAAAPPPGVPPPPPGVLAMVEQRIWQPFNGDYPPAGGWLWPGVSPTWAQPTTGEWLHTDAGHLPPRGPHWDYHNPAQAQHYRIYPDGTWEVKAADSAAAPPQVYVFHGGSKLYNEAIIYLGYYRQLQASALAARLGFYQLLTEDLYFGKGRFITWLPPGIDEARIASFTMGGLTSTAATEPLFAKQINQHLTGGGQPLAFFLNLLLPADTPFVKQQPLPYFTQSGEAYYYLTPKDAQTPQVQAVIRAAHTYPTVGVLTTLPEGMASPQHRQALEAETMITLVSSASCVIFGVYDNESWLLWERAAHNA